MRNDHFFPAKVSPKSQKSSKKAYFVKICCPKGAGALCAMREPMRLDADRLQNRSKSVIHQTFYD